ncbi:bifunctional nicotinamidase/pyrazinamidase [Paenochrobactrum sp. BZR 588]|uniref:bifunctional nicotinamidase/pyrazinamidase n=1 Tax=unclassified Paenochrobactrum TaxID=2639760 RepID=UPI00385454E3
MIAHALIVVDMQNDFCPGGALAVKGGDEFLPLLNATINESEHVILTQDWHPKGHSSFASSHEGKEPYQTIMMPYGEQTLWPDHCVQGTKGADFHPQLNRERAQLIIRKGFRHGIDSYSTFFENDHKTPTGLAGYLRERNIGAITLAGLATDFCVAFSALDAVELGFNTRVRLDLCRAIDVNGSLAVMLDKMRRAGVELIA